MKLKITFFMIAFLMSGPAFANTRFLTTGNLILMAIDYDTEKPEVINFGAWKMLGKNPESGAAPCSKVTATILDHNKKIIATIVCNSDAKDSYQLKLNKKLQEEPLLLIHLKGE